MGILLNELQNCEPFTAEGVEQCVRASIEANEWGMGAIMSAWRLVLVGAPMGPGLYEMAEAIGKEELVHRMKQGIERIGR